MGLTPSEERRTQKRIADNVCARCRREFQIGDRIQHAFILINPNARNPERVTERGLELGTDCELVHCSCEDPQLEGKAAARLRNSGSLILP